MNEKFSADHEEVLHYTTETGLRGIVINKTLWASHTSFLNDSEELVGFFDRVLPAILRPELERQVDESKHLVTRVEKVSRSRMDLLDDWLRKIVDGFKEAQCRSQDYYVTSFCTTDEPLISQHGLLSQWRGYGVDGGYAVVFDAKGLEELLNTERDMYYEEAWFWGDVQYHMADLANVRDAQVREHVQLLTQAVRDYWTTGNIEKIYPAFNHINLLSVFCKHRGFEEEKEVRIAVGEPSVELGQDPSNKSGKPYRKAHKYTRNGMVVPCIHLFEEQRLKTLPVRRIIVGPHPEKSQRKRAVEILLREYGIDAETSISDIPFRGK